LVLPLFAAREPLNSQPGPIPASTAVGLGIGSRGFEPFRCGAAAAPPAEHRRPRGEAWSVHPVGQARSHRCVHRGGDALLSPTLCLPLASLYFPILPPILSPL